MNEVTLHRGRHPHLTVVDAYFDGDHLTEAVVRLDLTCDVYSAKGSLCDPAVACYAL